MALKKREFTLESGAVDTYARAKITRYIFNSGGEFSLKLKQL